MVSFGWVEVSSGSCSDAQRGELLAQQQIQHFNLLCVAKMYNPQVWSSPTSSVVQAEALKCALSVLHFDIVHWESHNRIAFKHRVSEDRRQSWDVSIRRRSFFFFFFCRLEEEQLVANSKLTPTQYVTGNIDRSPARLSASSSCRLLDFIGDFLFTHLSERLNQVSEVFYP